MDIKVTVKKVDNGAFEVLAMEPTLNGYYFCAIVPTESHLMSILTMLRQGNNLTVRRYA